MRSWTVLGADGYLGTRLVPKLQATGLPGRALGRHEWIADGEDLGTVFYAIGLTADFRSRLADTMEAHVGRLLDLVRAARMERLVYFSSTRVYAGAASTAESTPLVVRSDSEDQLYNLSKLAGESACLALAPRGVVVRLSNVVGDDFDSPLFIPDVLRTAARDGQVHFQQGPRSAKDYVGTEQALNLVIRIARGGTGRIYNVGAGVNVGHSEIAAFLRSVGVQADFREGAADVCFPPIDVTQVQTEFGIFPQNLNHLLPILWPRYRERFSP